GWRGGPAAGRLRARETGGGPGRVRRGPPPRRACRDAEGVADMVRAIGPLSAAEVEERCTDPGAAPGWLAGLAAQRRLIEVRVAGEERWAAIEDAGRLRDALGGARPTRGPDA